MLLCHAAVKNWCKEFILLFLLCSTQLGMPTEEDLKAIVVHKKYSSSRKSKGESSRKRKRSSSSNSSHSSISSGYCHQVIVIIYN